MREIVYKLVKEDYQDWVHWNVKKNYSEKARKKTIIVFAALVFAFVVSGIFLNKNLSSTIPTLVLGIGGGMYILRTTSLEGQEKMVWKRSGLDRLEKSGNYPVIHLLLKDRGLVMKVENQEMVKDWGYKELVGIEEIDRLFLIEAVDKTWQFVAKSGFEDRAAMDEFLAFINEKIAAAKEDPESYTTEAMAQEDASAAADTEALAENADAAGIEAAAAAEPGTAEDAVKDAAEDSEMAATAEDDVVIEHVDTSSMGKIGKMAHIMAAMAAADAEEEKTDDAAQSAAVEDEEPAEAVETAEAVEAAEAVETAETAKAEV